MIAVRSNESSADEWVDSVFRGPGQGCGDSSVYMIEVSERFSVTLAALSSSSESGRWGRWCRHLSDPLTGISCDRFDRLLRAGPVDDLLCGCASAAVNVLLNTVMAGIGHMPALHLADRFYDFVCGFVPFGMFLSHASIMLDPESDA
jgi:hypothetical protein